MKPTMTNHKLAEMHTDSFRISARYSGSLRVAQHSTARLTSDELSYRNPRDANNYRLTCILAGEWHTPRCLHRCTHKHQRRAMTHSEIRTFQDISRLNDPQEPSCLCLPYRVQLSSCTRQQKFEVDFEINTPATGNMLYLVARSCTIAASQQVHTSLKSRRLARRYLQSQINRSPRGLLISAPSACMLRARSGPPQQTTLRSAYPNKGPNIRKLPCGPLV